MTFLCVEGIKKSYRLLASSYRLKRRVPPRSPSVNRQESGVVFAGSRKLEASSRFPDFPMFTHSRLLLQARQ
jgi:hypothetical protein